VRAIAFAEGKSYAKLGIEGRKLVQTLELFVPARAGPNVKRDAHLVVRGLRAAHKAATLLRSSNAWLTGAGSLFAPAYASLLASSTVGRRYGDVAVHRHKRI
jgi:hypothetical protein